MRIVLSLALIVAPVLVGPAMAASCPDPVDQGAEMMELLAQARAAPDETVGRVVAGEMWSLWLQAPNEQAQEILDRGLNRRDGFDFAGAFEDFDALVDYCPTYAEGFNQRAYVQFLQERFEAALVDLDAALALNPKHVAAQSGRALTLMQLGRLPEARAQLLEALENNPWLSERSLLANGAPLAPIGEDI